MLENILFWKDGNILLGKAILAGSVLLIAAVLSLYAFYDTRENYDRVPGRVVSVGEPVCESVRSAVTSSRHNRRQTIDCAQAEAVGKQDRMSVSVSSHLVYSYVTSSGQHRRGQAPVGVMHGSPKDLPKAGDMIIVLEHKTKPGVFRYGGTMTYQDERRLRKGLPLTEGG